MATVGHEALPTMSESLWVTKFGISGHYLTNVIFQYGGCWGPTCDLSLQQCERTPGNEFIHLHVQVNYVPLERLNAEALPGAKMPSLVQADVPYVTYVMRTVSPM